MALAPVIVVAGYGKFPQNTSAESLHSVLALVVRVNTQTHIVEDVSTTLLTRVADEFIRGLLCGTNLLEDDGFVTRFQESYFGHADRGVVAAFRDLAKRYRAVLASAQPSLATISVNGPTAP
jgi:hypothetical protein